MHPIANILLAAISTSFEIFLGFVVGIIAAYPKFDVLYDSQARKKLGKILYYCLMPLRNLRSFALGLDLELFRVLWIIPLMGLFNLNQQYVLAELFFRILFSYKCLNGPLKFIKKLIRKKSNKEKESDGEEENSGEDMDSSTDTSVDDQTSESEVGKEEEKKKKKGELPFSTMRFVYITTACMGSTRLISYVYLTSLAVNSGCFYLEDVEEMILSFVSLWGVLESPWYLSYYWNLIESHVPKEVKEEQEEENSSAKNENEDQSDRNSEPEFEVGKEQEEGYSTSSSLSSSSSSELDEKMEEGGDQEMEEGNEKEIIQPETNGLEGTTEKKNMPKHWYENLDRMPSWGIFCCFMKRTVHGETERMGIFPRTRDKISEHVIKKGRDFFEEKSPKSVKCCCLCCLKIFNMVKVNLTKLAKNAALVGMLAGSVIAVIPPLKDALFTNPLPILVSLTRLSELAARAYVGLSLVLVGANIGAVIFTPLDGGKEEEETKSRGFKKRIKKFWKDLRGVLILKHASYLGALGSVFFKLILMPIVGVIEVTIFMYTLGPILIEDEDVRVVVYMIMLISTAVPMSIGNSVTFSIFGYGMEACSEILLLHYSVSPITLAIYTSACLYYVCSFERCNL